MCRVCAAKCSKFTLIDLELKNQEEKKSLNESQNALPWEDSTDQYWDDYQALMDIPATETQHGSPEIVESSPDLETSPDEDIW